MRSKIAFIILLLFSVNIFAADLCQQYYEKSYRVFIKSELISRLSLASQSHKLSVDSLLSEMNQKGLLIYKGKHEFQAGTEFLASNEFDWARTPMDRTATDVVVGFGTNSAWDIALRKKAKQLVIGDWSPWPLISQAFLVSPLMRIAESPQEFILMISGLPKKAAKGKTLEQAFEISKAFDSLHPAEKVNILEITLLELAQDSRISDMELKFLTTYFRPLFAENINPFGWGPFEKLRHPQFANLKSFYSQRYNPQIVGNLDSVFSNLENFNYIRKMFKTGQVQYALASITDMGFYKQLVDRNAPKGYQNYTFSVSNIFDCGCYNGLSFKDFQNYLNNLLSITSLPITIFRTTNNVPPHGFYRYHINSVAEIPLQDEKDSSALRPAM